LLSLAPGLALGADEQEEQSRISATQSEQDEACEPCPCPAGSQTATDETPEVEEMPLYVPPNRGSPSARVGGGSRGSALPVS
jgi:hypothetical protein